MVLHACGSQIAFDAIMDVIHTGDVYPQSCAISWNIERGNPELEQVLQAHPDRRVWGTFPRSLLCLSDKSSTTPLDAFPQTRATRSKEHEDEDPSASEDDNASTDLSENGDAEEEEEQSDQGEFERESGPALKEWLKQHHDWLVATGFIHRVVVGPDCCPGAFCGEEHSQERWKQLQAAYDQWA